MKKYFIRYWFVIPLAFILIFSSAGYILYINNQYSRAIELSIRDDATYQEIEDAFRALGNFRDSAERAQFAYERRVEAEFEAEMKAEAEREEAERRFRYLEAIHLFEQGLYESAMYKFDYLRPYSESDYYFFESKYRLANELFEEGNYRRAAELYTILGNYEDSEIRLFNSLLFFMPEVQREVYNEAVYLMDMERFVEALVLFEKLVSFNYEPARVRVEEIREILNRLRLANTISAGNTHSTAITDERRLVGTGINTFHWRNISEWNDIVSVASGGDFTMGLRRDGTVKVTGLISDNSWADWENIIAISAGHLHGVGLKSDGTVLAFGHAGDNRTDVSEWENIVAIAAGVRHTVGLSEDGNVYIAGFGSARMQRDLLEYIYICENNPIIAICAGGGWVVGATDTHTVFLFLDGTVRAIGDNNFSQNHVEFWFNPAVDRHEERIIAISAGDWHIVGLRANGTVVSTFPGFETPGEWYEARVSEVRLDVYEWDNVVAISAGNGITLALRQNGTVLSIGYTLQEQRPAHEEWTNIAVYSEWRNWE